MMTAVSTGAPQESQHDESERGEILRPVPDDAATATRMGRFLTAALGPGDYHALHRWSVDDPEAFWRAVVAFFKLEITDLTTVLGDATMPGARWLPGARLSYSAHARSRSSAPRRRSS
jgi:acetoacetyl-CoA synthetase